MESPGARVHTVEFVGSPHIPSSVVGVTHEAEWRLCYVGEDMRMAYFTDQRVEDATGDDWDDAPWEHNSGPPYEHMSYRVYKLMFDPPFDLTLPLYPKNNVSVDQINAQQIPWLCTWNQEIWAGTLLEDFKDMIRDAGGTIYTREDE